MSTPTWSIECDYMESCNCDFGCTCNFSGLPNFGRCEALVAYHIRKGHFGGVFSGRIGFHLCGILAASDSPGGRHASGLHHGSSHRTAAPGDRGDRVRSSRGQWMFCCFRRHDALIPVLKTLYRSK